MLLGLVDMGESRCIGSKPLDTGEGLINLLETQSGE